MNSIIKRYAVLFLLLLDRPTALKLAYYNFSRLNVAIVDDASVGW